MKNLNKISIVVMVLLLLNLSFLSANAKISLTGGKGIHTFSLDEQGNNFFSEGSFVVHNKEQEPIEITAILESHFLNSDLDDGEPTTNSVGNHEVVFHEIPSLKWITLEKNNYTIEGKGSITVNYTVNFQRNEIPYYANNSNGFLCYVFINPSQKGTVSFSYGHKCFILFEGEQLNPFISPFAVVVYSLILTLVLFQIYDYIKKKRIKMKRRV